MFTKSNLLGTLVGTVIIFLLGWFFFGTLFESFWNAHTNVPEGTFREQAEVLYFVLGMIFMGFFLSTLYGQRKEKPHSFLAGLNTGLLVAGVIFGLFVGRFAFRATDDITSLIVTGLFSFIQFGIAGGVIALVYKATDKS